MKHDDRHKARVVANGNLMDTPLESFYSGVVSFRGLHTCIFLGELNNITPWATDIGNAYHEAKTTECVSMQGQNLGSYKETFLSLIRLFTDQDLVERHSTSCYLIVYVV